MFLGRYRFRGEPHVLLAAYRRMLAGMPRNQLLLHACVEQPAGLDVYDACPSRDVFDAFAAGEQFRSALRAAGLPQPEVQPLGAVAAAFADGRAVA